MLTLIPSKAWLEGNSFEGDIVLEDWFTPVSTFFSTSPEKENKQQRLVSGLADHASSVYTASSGCIRYEVCAGEVITGLPPSQVGHLMSTGIPASPEDLPSYTIQSDEICHTDYYCPPGGGGGDSGGGDPGDWPDLPPPGGGGGGPGGSLPGGPSDTHNPPSEAELSDMLENKPFALFGDVPCDVIRAWVATAKHTVSQSTWDKLYAIDQMIKPGTQFHYTNIQNINSAYSTVVNMDYFPVTINELPFVNGQQLTAPQFLEYIRKNINAFVDTDYSEFYPFNYSGVDDTQLWNSNNPLNAVVSIDIRGPDNGSVIVSHHSASKWTFTTIHDPMYLSHPVSGNRDFGYIQNANGSYTFYTRGVDRLTDPFGHYFQAFTDFPFNQADALWTSFVNKIRLFVNQNGGSAAMAFVEIERPNWQKVKDVLDGKAPLSTLSKDCPD